jgi:hypothetical protein
MAKRNAPSRIMSESPAGIPNAREGGVKANPGESRLLPATETPWNDLASTGETPPDNNQVVEETPPDEGKEEQIRALLNRQFKEEPEEKPPAATPAAAAPAVPADEKPPAAAPPATRKDILGALASEKARLKLEGQLRDERAKRTAAEQAVADPIAAARARGMTTEQILDLALGEKPAPPAHVAPPATEADKRLTRLEQERAQEKRTAALGVVDALTKDLDIPVVRATQRVTVTDGQGGSVVMSGKELVLETAKRLWEDDGSPDGQNHLYVAKAAQAVEAQLIEDQKDAFEAYAAKRGAPAGGAPAADPAPTPKPKADAPPALGRRTGGAGVQPAAAVKLPDDEDERHTAIKARFGWR